MQRTIASRTGLEIAYHKMQRFPKGGDALIAWDSADSYLVNYQHEHLADRNRILVLNDRFGAISVGTQRSNTLSYSDSYCATRALQENAELYDYQPQCIHRLDTSVDATPVDLVLIKLPKSLSQFEFQLQWLNTHLQTGVPVLVGAMIKHLPHSAKELIERYIGPVDLSHAWKKARLLITQKMEVARRHPNKERGFNVDSRRYFVNANVFCQNRLDPGASLMIEAFKTLGGADQVADLGCGSGVLGIEYSRMYHPESMHYFDESYDAIESASSNHSRLVATVSHSAKWGHSMNSAPANHFDLILNNPPFHQDQVIGDFIARDMFNDAKRALKPNGRLVVVGNRHLNYHHILRRWFKHVSLITSNSKFVVLSASNAE